MISSNSCLASSAPATSLKVVFLLSSISNLARLLPKENKPLAPPCICRSMKIQNPMNSNQGRKLKSRLYHWKGFSLN